MVMEIPNIATQIPKPKAEVKKGNLHTLTYLIHGPLTHMRRVSLVLVAYGRPNTNGALHADPTAGGPGIAGWLALACLLLRLELSDRLLGACRGGAQQIKVEAK